MFFESKKRWGGRFKLSTLFTAPGGGGIQRERVASVLKTRSEVRNEIAHYRPIKHQNFHVPLFEAATLASWFGNDLQHIYESIDTRESTELSVLLRGTPEYAKWEKGPDSAVCEFPGCTLAGPMNMLLRSAPRDQDELKEVAVTRFCLLHRVETRTTKHRP